ncbi:MAG: hypothetical protein EHM93_12185 [Bacteroidales bacterium]|nr:MAG: hypothetical protein EHM93_12185 [Bacteroidales bacterium]
MKKEKILTIVGVILALFVIFHIGIAYNIAISSVLTPEIKNSIQIFNAAVTFTLAFFAYVSLFKRDEMLNSKLGRFTSGFIAVFFVQRAIVDIALNGFNPFLISTLLIISIIYFYLAIPSKRVEAI